MKRFAILLLALLCCGCPTVPPVVNPVNPPDVDVPVDTEGKRVVFVYETSAGLSAEQQHVIDSTEIRKLLKEKCAPDGFRFWDKDTEVKADSRTWKAIWDSLDETRADAKKRPQVVIFSGQRGKAFPFDTEKKTLDLLRKHLGK